MIELLQRICCHGKNLVFQNNDKQVVQRSAHNYLLFLINRELDSISAKRIHRMVLSVENSEVAEVFSQLSESEFSLDFPLFQKTARSFDKNILRGIIYQRAKAQFLQILQQSRISELDFLKRFFSPMSFDLITKELTINKIEL